jgi:signal transduction histidine kinase
MSGLLASAEKMAGGAVDHRAEISPAHDELDALAFAMNVMVGELSFGAAQLARAKEEAERRSVELARAQGSLLSKERLATLGQLAGGIAHQIRNPLAIILNATSVVKRNLPQSRHADVDSAISIIEEEIRHADAIVSALLDYASLRQPERQPVSMLELVERVLGAPLLPPSVRVQKSVDADVPLVHADADQLNDALMNLVLNAVEAMPDGGTLSVEVMMRESCVVIGVSDTGAGIPPQLEPRLFEPLHSTKPMGVGLGLVTARTFVEAHGGSIVAVPVPAGARFEIRLPVGTP